MSINCETIMQSRMIFGFVTTFHNACFMTASFKWLAGFSPLGWPTGENPARRRGFHGGHAIALAIAMTCERMMMRTMSFRSVTTFNKASFMTVSSKKVGEITPSEGRNLPRG